MWLAISQSTAPVWDHHGKYYVSIFIKSVGLLSEPHTRVAQGSRGWEEGPGEGASLPASGAAREALGRCWLPQGRAWTVTLKLVDPRRLAGRSSPFAVAARVDRCR